MLSMPSIHTAIVLHVPTTQRTWYLLFDKKLGTIDLQLSAKSSARQLPRGALIEYVAESHRRWISPYNLEIVAVPDSWVINNISFLHQLIELIDFFVPRGHQAEEIFTLLQLLYVPLGNEIDIPFFKHIFLCKFFFMIGLYPEPRSADDREFLTILSTCIGVGSTVLADEEKYVFLEKKMIQWLRECIFLHPYADRLKTMTMEPLVRL